MFYLWLTWLVSPLLRIMAGRAPAESQRILVIQMAKIGDLLCATPVFREIKARYPQAHLAVMATAQNVPLLRANPQVDEVVVAEAKTFRGLGGKVRLVRLWRQGHYDTVVCLNAGAAYAVAALWALIPQRLAVQSNFGGTSHRLAAHLWSRVELHRGDRLIQETYLALLAQLGVNGGRVDKEVFTAGGADDKVVAVLGLVRGPLVGIGVSSANRLKALGSKKIIEVARQMLARHPAACLVLIGSADDQAQAQEIASQLPAGAVIDACGAVGIAELPALLKRLTVFIGVDSGVTYMADAVGVPLVSIAGPCNMQETRPLGQQVIILQRADLPCAPCAHIFHAPYTCHVGTRACIEEIDARQIADAALSLYGDSVKTSAS
ncbi:MAG: glycosyltransferase family 9 protein [Rugosibacter sp.]|nr:glycosyltransferase family 9 protein [Rugosibacter sp.]